MSYLTSSTIIPRIQFLNQLIQIGIASPGHPCDIAAVGCMAVDEESYVVFADLLDSIIEKQHNAPVKPSKKSVIDFVHLCNIEG